MGRRTVSIAVSLLAIFSLGLLPIPVSAGQPNRAGLAIRFEGDRIVTRCVEFEEKEITGSELIARSGLDVNIDSSRGLGITVCKIEGLGCDYPADACFCQCMGGGTCRYWNYYYRDPGQSEWIYSPLGALLRKVQPGSVEAWVWGDGHMPPDDVLTFESICVPATPSPVPTQLVLTPAASKPIGVPTVALVPTQAPATSSATTLPTPMAGLPAAPASGSSPSPSIYWPFGVLLLLLIGVAAYLRLGRK